MVVNEFDTPPDKDTIHCIPRETMAMISYRNENESLFSKTLNVPKM